MVDIIRFYIDRFTCVGLDRNYLCVMHSLLAMAWRLQYSITVTIERDNMYYFLYLSGTEYRIETQTASDYDRNSRLHAAAICMSDDRDYLINLIKEL